MFACIVPIIALGILLLNGKGGFLVAGLNTMSAEKKAKYDIKAVCRYAGWLVLAIALWLALFTVGGILRISWWHYLMLAVLAVGLIGSIIYANTGKRFYKKDRPGTSTAEDSEEAKPSTAKITVIIAVAISVIVTAAVGIMFYYGESEAAINVLDDSIQIRGMYGLSVDFAEITNISIVENDMRSIGVGTRTNGFGGFGDTLKGTFHSENHGAVLLFVRSSASPTIHIERDNSKDVFISFQDGERTRILYDEMLRAFSSRVE